MNEFRELVAPSLTTLFVEEITRSILSNTLKVGEKLPNERELAAMMKVSRAVVKGGINRLANKGFVKVVPRKGVFVEDYKRQGGAEILLSLLEYNNGELEPPLLDSLYEVRENTECDIIRLAAIHRTEHDLLALREQMKMLEQENDPQKLAEETFKFYHLLAIASGNFVYPLTFYNSGKIYIPLFRMVYRKIPKTKRLQRMKKLVDLIEKKDVDESVECARELIKWGRKMVEKAVKLP